MPRKVSTHSPTPSMSTYVSGAEPSFFSQRFIRSRNECRMYLSSHGTILWIGACTELYAEIA